IAADSDIYLIIDEANLEQAVRDLIRVGLDNIKGYATPAELNDWDGKLERTEAVGFGAVSRHKDDADVQVLDVRKATEHAEGNVPGAINIAHTRLADHLDELSKDKQLYVHCGSGQPASYASGLLARNGFNIPWVDDMFTNWEKSSG